MSEWELLSSSPYYLRKNIEFEGLKYRVVIIGDFGIYKCYLFDDSNRKITNDLFKLYGFVYTDYYTEEKLRNLAEELAKLYLYRKFNHKCIVCGAAAENYAKFFRDYVFVCNDHLWLFESE